MRPSWCPADEPDSDDTAIFNTPNSVDLGSNNSILALTMSGGISLNTNDFERRGSQHHRNTLPIHRFSHESHAAGINGQSSLSTITDRRYKADIVRAW